MANFLANETSPYLLQHAENPVEWYPWGEQALALAKQLNKPILLSIGYSACHWCHVMAHESFEDPEVAAVMNAHFINIKVDREERPDIDQIYQTAHSMLSQRSGGWPLTVFLTPDQQPYFTGTYFPKTPRYQLPGFGDLVPRVAQFYHEKKSELADQNQQLSAAFSRTVPVANTQISNNTDTLNLAFRSLENSFDFTYGGFGSAPKFPNPADITLLLHEANLGNQRAESMALQMLSAMADGGIYDQLGGGFCRYSVDARWQIPHFEKMLYDNGQLLFLYADAYLLTKNERYSAILTQTVDWLVREMRTEHGAFYSSLDADSVPYDAVEVTHAQAEEGAFYVWQRDEVRANLNDEEFALASRVLGFDRETNFEDPHTAKTAWHPFMAAELNDFEMPIFEAVRHKLWQARETRPRPGLDDKILTSWNALVIKGLARAGRALQRQDWIVLAQQVVDFIEKNLWDGDKLLATHKDGVSHLNAYCDDYAYLLDALIELLQADFRAQDLSFAQALADALLTNFQAADGGFYFTSHTHEKLYHRAKQPFDNATPNSNGIAAVALQRLGHLLGEVRYLQAAENCLKAFDSAIASNPAACASLSHALREYLNPPRTVILRGKTQDLTIWKAEISSIYQPHTVVLVLPNSLENVPEQFVNFVCDDVNAWVCQGVNCAMPITNLKELLNVL